MDKAKSKEVVFLTLFILGSVLIKCGHIFYVFLFDSTSEKELGQTLKEGLFSINGWWEYVSTMPGLLFFGGGFTVFFGAVIYASLVKTDSTEEVGGGVKPVKATVRKVKQGRGLKPLGKAFYAQVETRWPEFLPYARMNLKGDLEFSVPSPNPNENNGLWIVVDEDDQETRIFFGGGHSHGGPLELPEDPDFDFKFTTETIDGIIAEDIVGSSYANGGSLGPLHLLKKRGGVGQSISIKSWKGSHDS